MDVGSLVGFINFELLFSHVLVSMEPEAEQNCESLLNLAIQADPSNVEVLQSMASVRMSQQRPDDARKCIEQAWGLWNDLPPGTYHPFYIRRHFLIIA